jgi:hypothetical protein
MSTKAPDTRSASATRNFYFCIFREEAAKLLGEGSISQYMEKVIQRIEAEDVRSANMTKARERKNRR